MISTLKEVFMRTISYSEARQNLSATMVKTVEDHAPILITRQNGESCVLMSLEEYNSLEETAYLLRSPANARRLSDSIESLKSERGIEKDIIE
jgi:antitoxin YefM